MGVDDKYIIAAINDLIDREEHNRVESANEAAYRSGRLTALSDCMRIVVNAPNKEDNGNV
jgi:hypothetical protein